MIRIDEELRERMKDIDWRQYTIDEERFKIQLKGYSTKDDFWCIIEQERDCKEEDCILAVVEDMLQNPEMEDLDNSTITINFVSR